MLNLGVPSKNFDVDLFILYIEIHVWYIHNYKLLGIMLRMNKVEKSKILSPRATLN